jgi:hypothetical protein
MVLHVANDRTVICTEFMHVDLVRPDPGQDDKPYTIWAWLHTRSSSESQRDYAGLLPPNLQMRT